MSIKNIDDLGNITWKNEKGELHREDGPAVESVNGDRLWYINGKLHRENGPAVESILLKYVKYGKVKYKYRVRAWYINGEKHRVKGPAVEYANGRKEYYLYGEKVFDRIYRNLTRNERIKKILKDRNSTLRYIENAKKWIKN